MKIELRDITKRFGANTVLQNIHLDVKEGEFFFILGPSGCGKTTLLRILAGFEAPSEGDVLFDGESVLSTPPNRRNIGMVFQNYALWPHLDVQANVQFGLEMRSVGVEEARRRVKEVLEMVQLDGFEKRLPNQLSGGQQQRVALARALVTKPGLLLLDEPLSNLDARLRLEMRDELHRVQKATGITAVYVTHDQKEALSMADRMVILKDGVIMQEGNPFSVYRRPLSLFVAGFMGEANFLDGAVRSVEGEEIHLDTPLGPLMGRLRKLVFQPGEAVSVSIRPESLRLARAGDDDTVDCFAGRVQRSLFMGENEHFWIDVGEGHVLKMMINNPPPGMNKEGTVLQLKVAPEDVVVLKRDGAAS